MSSGSISLQLGSLWKKAGIYDKNSKKRNVCATLIRKGASTGVRQSKVGNLQEIADIMAHSVSTADKHYYTRHKRETAASVGKTLRSFFHSHDDNLSMPSDSQICFESPGGRKKWRKSEENVLKKAFDMENPTMSQVIEKLPSLGIKATPKKVYDKLRTYSPAAVKTNLTPKREKMYSKEDILLMHKTCGELFKGGPLTEARIIDCVKDSTLINKYTWCQLRSRIVYERKKQTLSKKIKIYDEIPSNNKA